MFANFKDLRWTLSFWILYSCISIEFDEQILFWHCHFHSFLNLVELVKMCLIFSAALNQTVLQGIKNFLEELHIWMQESIEYHFPSYVTPQFSSVDMVVPLGVQ